MILPCLHMSTWLVWRAYHWRRDPSKKPCNAHTHHNKDCLFWKINWKGQKKQGFFRSWAKTNWNFFFLKALYIYIYKKSIILNFGYSLFDICFTDEIINFHFYQLEYRYFPNFFKNSLNNKTKKNFVKHVFGFKFKNFLHWKIVIIINFWLSFLSSSCFITSVQTLSETVT